MSGVALRDTVAKGTRPLQLFDDTSSITIESIFFPENILDVESTQPDNIPMNLKCVLESLGIQNTPEPQLSSHRSLWFIRDIILTPSKGQLRFYTIQFNVDLNHMKMITATTSSVLTFTASINFLTALNNSATIHIPFRPRQPAFNISLNKVDTAIDPDRIEIPIIKGKSMYIQVL